MTVVRNPGYTSWMDVNYQRRAAFRLAVVAGVLFVMSFAGKQVRDRREAAAKAAEEVVALEDLAPPDKGVYAPGSRAPVPPPAAPASSGPSSLEEGVDPRVAVTSQLESLGPVVKDCLHQWWMIDPALTGDIQLEFVFNADGLGGVDILDHSEVPVGPLGCFTEALYGTAWPPLGEETVIRHSYAIGS